MRRLLERMFGKTGSHWVIRTNVLNLNSRNLWLHGGAGLQAGIFPRVTSWFFSLNSTCSPLNVEETAV